MFFWYRRILAPAYETDGSNSWDSPSGTKKKSSYLPVENGAVDEVDVPSPLERYFGRPIDDSYDELTYLEYHSRYSVVLSQSRVNPAQMVVGLHGLQKKERHPYCASSILFIPANRELFALRLLLQQFCARGWEGTANRSRPSMSHTF
jgi:hypothetical protein